MSESLSDLVCVKCGGQAGWEGPTYVHVAYVILEKGQQPPQTAMEWLMFRCKTCGYERQEPTKDAPTPSLAAFTAALDRLDAVVQNQKRAWWRGWR